MKEGASAKHVINIGQSSLNNIFQAITLWPSWANILMGIFFCCCFFRYACGRIVNWNTGSRPTSNAIQVVGFYLFSFLGKMNEIDFLRSNNNDYLINHQGRNFQWNWWKTSCHVPINENDYNQFGSKNPFLFSLYLCAVVSFVLSFILGKTFSA